VEYVSILPCEADVLGWGFARDSALVRIDKTDPVVLSRRVNPLTSGFVELIGGFVEKK